MDTASHNSVVLKQYEPRAAAYVNSAVHAAGEDLERLAAVVGSRPDAVALDLGCGGGHVSYRLAPLVGKVVACDLSEAMLAAVREEARVRGLGNLETRQASADALPFDDAAFDLVATRFSAHHWHAFDGGLAEMQRVLESGSTAVFMDVVSPGSFLLDTWLQSLELLRDPSHVRNASTAEWLAALARADFAIEECRTFRLRLAFPTWVARMNTPAPHVAAIRSLQDRAAPAVKEYFEIEDDGSFTVDTAFFLARKA